MTLYVETFGLCTLTVCLNDAGEGEASVAARGLSASWADDKTKLTLNDISFSVNKVQS